MLIIVHIIVLPFELAPYKLNLGIIPAFFPCNLYADLILEPTIDALFFIADHPLPIKHWSWQDLGNLAFPLKYFKLSALVMLCWQLINALCVPCPGIEGLHRFVGMMTDSVIVSKKHSFLTLKGNSKIFIEMKLIFLACFLHLIHGHDLLFFSQCHSSRAANHKQHKQMCSEIRLTFCSHYYLAVMFYPVKYLFVLFQHKTFG